MQMVVGAVEEDVAVREAPAIGGAAPMGGVSWGAVLGGAFVIGALAPILIALGAGFGLSSVSPWPGRGASLTTFGVMAAIWLLVVQWLSSAVGGYLAGRLGGRSAGLHADQSYFRDTAHGLLAWAVAAVVGAALFAGAAAALTGSATAVAAGAAQSAAQSDPATGPSSYLLDELFRSDRPDTAANASDPRPEASRIIASGLRPGGDVSAADHDFLVRAVAARSGISQDQAQKRVDDVIAQARKAADAARKATAQLSLYTAISMLVGAFIAGVAGKIGGHHRDDLTAM